MKRFQGTQPVGPGIYFNARQFAFKSMEHDGSLPGTPQDEYLRVPWAVLIFAGPVLGLAYVVFLPLIGCAMVLWLLAGKVGELATGLAHRAARVMRPGWEPSMAYLSRSRTEHDDEDAVTKNRDDWSRAVHEELTPDSQEADRK